MLNTQSQGQETVGVDEAMVRLFSSLMTTYHGDRDRAYADHVAILGENPMFYEHFACWGVQQQNVKIRDVKEVIVASLIMEGEPSSREVGLGLLHTFAPYQVANIVRFIRRDWNTRVRPAELINQRFWFKRTKSSIMLLPENKKAEADGQMTYLEYLQAKNPGAEITTRKYILKYDGNRNRHNRHVRVRTNLPEGYIQVLMKSGMDQPIPRALRTEITYYLQQLEKNHRRFDGAVLRAREDLRYLYSVCKIGPDERAQKILFDREVPEDAKRLQFLKDIDEYTPLEQAKLLIKNKIPYTTAAAIVEMSPVIQYALIEVMSPKEVTNMFATLCDQGAYADGTPTRELIDKKLEGLKTADNVDALKIREAVKVAESRGHVSETVTKVTDDAVTAQVQKAGSIAASTLICTDISSSMNPAKAAAQQIAPAIFTACTGELKFMAFNSAPYTLAEGKRNYSDVERDIARLPVGGSTSMGACLKSARLSGWRMEQIIFITDDDENRPPRFYDEYQLYAKELGIKPRIIIVYISTGYSTPRSVENACQRLGVDFERYEWNSSDYLAVPGLINLLSKGTSQDIVIEVMMTPLARRKAGHHLV